MFEFQGLKAVGFNMGFNWVHNLYSPTVLYLVPSSCCKIFAATARSERIRKSLPMEISLLVPARNSASSPEAGSGHSSTFQLNLGRFCC